MLSQKSAYAWWHHQMETFSALLAFCAVNSPVSDEFPAQRPMARGFDDFFDRLNERVSKQSWGYWSETSSRPLWRHCCRTDSVHHTRSYQAQCHESHPPIFVNGPLQLQWRHNGRNSVSNHQPDDCLLNRVFRRRSKKTSKLRGIHRGPVNSPHKWPVTRKMFPFDDVIMLQDHKQPSTQCISVNH